MERCWSYSREPLEFSWKAAEYLLERCWISTGLIDAKTPGSIPGAPFSYVFLVLGMGEIDGPAISKPCVKYLVTFYTAFYMHDSRVISIATFS